ncbi:MAG: pyruvate ferredoxin oxidoreductase [Candidatus Cloacimonetes bacterium 4572_65]|nr:MAG: pyruvate ferredoxin oxidoreductase [Candidatus Cloacimonetes bacterium 4572_65]
MIEVRWHGRGGQGGFTVSRLLGMAVSLFNGKHAIAFPAFGPERRGAPVLAFTKIDDTKIDDRSEVELCDYVVIMDETLINPSIVKGLKDDSSILINTTNPAKYVKFFPKNNKIYSIDATNIALEVLKRAITNTTMLGALIAISSITDLESCKKSIDNELKPVIAEKNKLVLERAFKEVKEYRG